MDVSSVIGANNVITVGAQQKIQQQKNMTQSLADAATAKQQAAQDAAQRAETNKQAQLQLQQQQEQQTVQTQKLQAQGSKGGVLNVFA